MGSESETFSQLEIAHVLFTDIVGYSKKPIARSEIGSLRSEVRMRFFATKKKILHESDAS
jgi:hypothetical protein